MTTENNDTPRYGEITPEHVREAEAALRNPKPPKKSKKRFILPLALLVGGMIIGSASAASVKPEPVVQVKEVTKEVPVEKIVTKQVTPPSCIEALDLASKAVTTLAKIGPLAGRGIMAASAGNPTELNAVTSEVKAVNAEIDEQNPALGAASSACRASAE